MHNINQIVTKMLFRAYSTSTSRVVPHHSTILAVYSLTSRFGWDVVHSISYGRRHYLGLTHAFQPNRWFFLLLLFSPGPNLSQTPLIITQNTDSNPNQLTETRFVRVKGIKHPLTTPKKC